MMWCVIKLYAWIYNMQFVIDMFLCHCMRSVHPNCETNYDMTAWPVNHLHCNGISQLTVKKI